MAMATPQDSRGRWGADPANTAADAGGPIIANAWCQPCGKERVRGQHPVAVVRNTPSGVLYEAEIADPATRAQTADMEAELRAESGRRVPAPSVLHRVLIDTHPGPDLNAYCQRHGHLTVSVVALRSALKGLKSPAKVVARPRR